jgi:hypothetical protein
MVAVVMKPCCLKFQKLKKPFDKSKDKHEEGVDFLKFFFGNNSFFHNLNNFHVAQVA